MIDPVDGDRLKRAWRALADDAPEGSRPGPAVDDDTVWRVAAGQGSADERRTVLDALAADPAVAESWRLAVELQRQLEPSVAGTRPTASRRRPALRVWAPWVAAASLVLAIGLGLWTQLEPGGPPVYRDPGAPVGEIGGITNQVSESEAMPRHDAVLRWSFSGVGEDGGTEVRYTVRVFTSELAPLLVLDDLTSPEARLPGEQLVDLPDPTQLLWQVEAHTADGRVVTSPTFFLELAPVSDAKGRDGSSDPSTAPAKPSDSDSSSMEP